jgi:hypothetical protein
MVVAPVHSPRGSVDGDEAKAAIVGRGEEESLMRTVKMHVQPWRLNVDGTRAVLDLVLVGIGYLL